MERNFQKAVTIFIDVLGSQDRNNFEECYDIINLFCNTIEREKKLDDAHQYTVYKREIHVFSDCAYIIYDYKEGIEEERKDINALMCIACYNTEKILYEFLKNGFITRGAITYGDIYYESDRNVWFGPAMNRAYYLESKMAKYPRLIIDPDYSENLNQYNEMKYRLSEEQQTCNGEIIKKDFDDLFYLNFLNTTQLGVNHYEGRETIKNTLRICENEKERERDNEQLRCSIIEKYDWLERYLIYTNEQLENNVNRMVYL